MELFTEFIQHFTDMFIDMSFYILLGLLCVGILHVFVKKESILKHLGADRFSSVVKASAVGVPLPLCSCGVVPTAIELKKGGASNGAVISFLTSTPQTGIDSIFATYSLMGPIMAVFRPIAAFCSGIIGGAVVNFLAKEETGEMETTTHCCCSSTEETTSCCKVEETSCCGGHEKKENKLVAVLSYAFGDFLDEISTHFLVGMVVAAGISTLLPADFFVSLGLHEGFLSMFAMVLIGLPMYICSASSIPIALSLMEKGLSLGGGFVFLFTGPVTNMASLVVLGKALGRKVTGMYICSVIACSVFFGWILDYFTAYFQLTSSIIDCHTGHEELGMVSILSALVFAVLITKGIYINLKARIMAKSKK